jgi:hypothetical protein
MAPLHMSIRIIAPTRCEVLASLIFGRYEIWLRHCGATENYFSVGLQLLLYRRYYFAPSAHYYATFYLFIAIMLLSNMK